MTERDIFIAALHQHDPAERAAFLDRACAENPAVRQRVEGLLREEEQLGSFLERPAVGAGIVGAGTPAPDGDTLTVAGTGPGAIIGPYQLVEVIGEGGMGTVYLAEQTDPVRRHVALKVIKAGMDSREVIARFEAERQALALMDHPHIARVLDAGATPAGRPYFVMDLVKGVPITRYCDEHHLTPRQRLELFIPVCQAVQHAHQKGIIHRDLKPSNVLVALYDGKPVPKVIDFGVAKAAGQSLTEKTLVTGFGAIVGTLEYMSPEQAEINQLDIDTRSDVYSLGVLLYELLSGSTPFTRKDLEKAGMLEMLRVIREQEPSKPSTKLSTAEGLPTLAANRGTEAAKLARLVKGELDWIVMKALEKDRNRRYETANDFALDVQRYMADEPVEACPPSAGYRLRKFVRRNRGAVVAATIGLFMLLLLLVVAWISNWQINLALTDRNQALGQLTHEQEKTAQTLVLEKQLRKDANEALEQERLALYSYRVSLAQREWYANRVGRAEFLLDECPPPLRGWEWHYLKRLCHADLMTIRAHDWMAHGAAFSPDGKQLASSGADGFVRVWDVATGRELHRLTAPAHIGHCPLFSPDGRWLAAAGDRTIRLWDTATGKPQRTFPGHERDVLCLAFSPDSQQLAAASGESVLRIWDVARGEIARSIRATRGIIRDVAFSGDGICLAWEEAAEAVVAEAATGKELRRWNVGPGPFRGVLSCLQFSKDGRRLATGGQQGTPLVIWNVASGKEVFTLGRGIDVHDLAFSPDGQWLATAHPDQTVRIWDTAGGGEKRVLRGHTAPVHSVAFDSKGARLVSASADRSVKVWNPAADQDVRVGSHKRLTQLTCMAVSPDGRRLALGGTYRDVLFCETTGGAQVDALTTRHRITTSVAFSPDGKRLATGGVEGMVRVWDVESKKQLVASPGHTNVIDLGFSSVGGLLASAGVEGKVILRDAKGAEIRTLTFTKPVVLAFSPNGQWLATGEHRTSTGKQAAIRIWDVATGRELRCLPGHEKMVQCAAFSPDGKHLATGSVDREVKLWDAVTGAELRTLGGHANGVSAVAFHPTGRRLAAGTHDGTIVIWDLTTGREAVSLRGGEKRIQTVAFLRDGTTLAAGCSDGLVRFWDATPLKEPPKALK